MPTWSRQVRAYSIGLAFVAAVLVSYLLGVAHSPGKAMKGGRQVLYYVDPMHPAYKSNQPGTAPDCGMPLEPVYADQVSATASPDGGPLTPGAVRISGAEQQAAGIQLVSVALQGGVRTIHAAGRVIPEDTRTYRVNSGVDGFVRETFDDAAGTVVRKGQKLATYYAPDFIAAASGFLAASERLPGTVTNEGAKSIQNYKDRLRNLGMSDVQIQHTAATRQLPESIDVLAPSDGIILARNISPGQHFTHEMEFYQVADLTKVWIVAELYQPDQPYLRPGIAAQISEPGESHSFHGRVTDSLPQTELSGGSTKIRLEVENPGLRLRPGMVVDAAFAVHTPRSLVIPTDALLASGTHERVYVEHGAGVFEPREVQTGWRTDTAVEVLSGLKAGERVVSASTFLVDSESRLKSGGQPILARATSTVRPNEPAAARP